MENSNLKLFMAPMQGYTDAPYRRFHADVYGPVDGCITPFLRVERGDVRSRDLRDITSPLNDGLDVTPQIIFRDLDEFRFLASVVADAGFERVDLNLGCPFPPQCKKGRGAAMVERPDVMGRVMDEVAAMEGKLRFSVKMRLGLEEPGRWRELLPLLNGGPLERITVHPRTAAGQYNGPLYLEEFGELLSLSVHPVVYNGELRTPADIDAVATRFPGIEGVMIGRGLLGRPSMILEHRDRKELPESERVRLLLRFHSLLLDHYGEKLCGDAQLLAQMKPFWEYLEDEIGRKAWKTIHKAQSMNRYREAVAGIGR